MRPLRLNGLHIAPGGRTARLERCDGVLVAVSDTAGRLVQLLAERGIGGGSVYDALIGLTAKRAGATLLTRDLRARATYLAVGVEHEVLG